MQKLTRIETLLVAPLAEKGYEILQLRYIKTGRPILQFLIDRLDEEAVTMGDCAAASRLISVQLDVDDPIPEAYLLEVSSPGLDRPLTQLKHYPRFLKQMVKFELHTAVEGQKRFKGTIERVEGSLIVFQTEATQTTEGKELTVPFSEVYHCKLLLNL